MAHHYEYPQAHEVTNVRLLHDDIANPPNEPPEDFSECIIHMAKRLAKEALDEG